MRWVGTFLLNFHMALNYRGYLLNFAYDHNLFHPLILENKVVNFRDYEVK